LDPAKLFVVPKGVEHRPVAQEETHILLMEPSGTPNTGDARTLPQSGASSDRAQRATAPARSPHDQLARILASAARNPLSVITTLSLKPTPVVPAQRNTRWRVERHARSSMAVSANGDLAERSTHDGGKPMPTA
jgi:hypothetical protein